MTAEIYVHRIGRTARAGAAGIAVTFCDRDERSMLRDIERLTRQRLSVAQHELASDSGARGAAAQPGVDSERLGPSTNHIPNGRGGHKRFGQRQPTRSQVTGRAGRYGRRLSTV